MKMEDLAGLAPTEPLMVSPEVFQQLGSITRLLHDTMQQLGVMPKLQNAADGLLAPLAELLTVEPGYETAAASALGSLADAIVTVDGTAAVGALTALRAGDGGRAALIVSGLPVNGSKTARACVLPCLLRVLMLRRPRLPVLISLVSTIWPNKSRLARWTLTL